MKAAKVDLNQKEIVDALRKAGVSVHSTAKMGGGFPDLVVGKGDQYWLMEIKGLKGKLTEGQIKFLNEWKAAVHIVRTVDDALKIIGVINE